MNSNTIQFSEWSYNSTLEELTFRVDGTKAPVINGIVQTMKNYIPSVGFNTDEMIIYKNTLENGKIHNDLLQERLKLIPLHFNRSEIEEPYQKNKYTFTLHKKNTTNDSIYVTTHDIYIYDFEGNLMSKEFHERIFPKNPITGDYVLIGYLQPNEYNTDNGDEVSFRLNASLGTGKDHTMYEPVSAPRSHFIIDENKAPTDVRPIYRKQYYIKDEEGDASAFGVGLESINGWKPWEIVERSFDELVYLLDSLKNDTIEIIHEEEKRVRLISTRLEQRHLRILQKMSIVQERQSYVKGTQLPKIRYMGINIPHQTVEKAFVEYTAEDLSTNITDMHDLIDNTKSYIMNCKQMFCQFYETNKPSV